MNVEKKLPEKVLRIIKDIPAIPDIVVAVMQMTRDPDVTAKQLTDRISQDPGLTANILRLCNSAYYGMPRVVSSLNQAIMYLGFHTIRSLVLTCSFNRFFNPGKPIYGYVKGGIWHHSIACAIASDLICKQVHSEVHDSAFTAGLLHDAGQLALGLSIKDTADTIIDLMTNENLPELEAEREAVGFTHEDLGAHLADAWNFPDELIHAMQHHHNPIESETQSEMTSIVHIADAIVLDLGCGVDLEQMKYPVNPNALKMLNKDQAWLDSMKVEAAALIEEQSFQFLQTFD